ncbi:PilW family protein, partial [Deinococcus pimensis]|uniref:PilW family protein n=1 Tax=Deinococcus pimensis TaxID=309888 RepID=UPI0005EBD4CD
MSRPEVRRAGMTVVELLVGLAILGVVLFAALSLLTAGQDVTSFQQRRTLTLDDARAAMSRVVEVGSQASYVYPAGLTLTTGEGLRGARSEGELTTGRSALALLVWDGRSTSPPRYHAVVFYVADRARFAEDLPGTGQGSALVEATTEVPGVPGAITWPRNA